MVGSFKPDPAIIKLALHRAGLEARYTVMFEDSDDGVAACNAARVPCIGIRGRITDESKCIMMIDDYVGLKIDDIINCV
jgi:beta-phosphoglucomutase-like phosphatase (HAD superfamily)